MKVACLKPKRVVMRYLKCMKNKMCNSNNNTKVGRNNWEYTVVRLICCI